MFGGGGSPDGNSWLDGRSFIRVPQIATNTQARAKRTMILLSTFFTSSLGVLLGPSFITKEGRCYWSPFYFQRSPRISPNGVRASYSQRKEPLLLIKSFGATHLAPENRIHHALLLAVAWHWKETNGLALGSKCVWVSLNPSLNGSIAESIAFWLAFRKNIIWLVLTGFLNNILAFIQSESIVQSISSGWHSELRNPSIAVQSMNLIWLHHQSINQSIDQFINQSLKVGILINPVFLKF